MWRRRRRRREGFPATPSRSKGSTAMMELDLGFFLKGRGERQMWSGIY